jgi:hypothetical protein
VHLNCTYARLRCHFGKQLLLLAFLLQLPLLPLLLLPLPLPLLPLLLLPLPLPLLLLVCLLPLLLLLLLLLLHSPLGSVGILVMNTARPMVCVCTRTANVVSGWKPL